MLDNLKIENFRGFESFELQQLGRVNLLVGQNNSGKTSILEAIQLLCSRTDLDALVEIMNNRGEYLHCEENPSSSRLLEIRHLFYKHEIKLNSQLSIFGKNGKSIEKLIISIGGDQKKISINIQWSHDIEKENISTNLSGDGKSREEFFRVSRGINDLKKIKNKPIKTHFITSSSLTADEMIEFFDQVVLTSEEKVIQESVKTIDKNIERIAPISSKKYRNLGFREGFFVLRSDNHQRVPIGSFGDGTWRMLGLVLAIVNVKNGVLLVDEIDTGLHFTAMSKMWKLIWETAKRLNVQVFATTHNSDCWKSLASIACQENAHEEGGITIQRIEPDKSTAIAFNEPEIVIAAEQDIEVR